MKMFTPLAPLMLIALILGMAASPHISTILAFSGCMAASLTAINYNVYHKMQLRLQGLAMLWFIGDGALTTFVIVLIAVGMMIAKHLPW